MLEESAATEMKSENVVDVTVYAWYDGHGVDPVMSRWPRRVYHGD